MEFEEQLIYLLYMAPSSSGLGREPLTLETGVRFSVGSPMQFLNCDEKR